MDYIDTWGLYECFSTHDYELVDAGCRDEFFRLNPGGKVFHCISMNGGNITLKYGEKVFQVRPQLYRIVKEPFYKVGDKVEIIEKSITGKIIDINWHTKDKASFYFIEIEGKRLKKRYWDCDLRKVD